jgi:transporter family-2 protein
MSGHHDFLEHPLSSIRYALWSAAAGALIPVMGVLNARLGKTLGEPLHAPVVLFGVGFLACLLTAILFTGALPNWSKLSGARPIDFAGGLIVAFYVISVTWLAPSFGIANVILYAMVAQIVFSGFINHFGLFESLVQPINGLRVFGIVLLLAGLVITQIAQAKAN